jgi:hypothetical protein
MAATFVQETFVQLTAAAGGRAALQGLPGAVQSDSIISRIEKRRTNSVEQLGQR